jgi:hypothetical protein
MPDFFLILFAHSFFLVRFCIWFALVVAVQTYSIAIACALHNHMAGILIDILMGDYYPLQMNQMISILCTYCIAS